MEDPLTQHKVSIEFTVEAKQKTLYQNDMDFEIN